MINFKFILTATLTFIPYTVLSFFWHNNIMHKVYYPLPSMYTIAEQNIWAMNFANALLVYGFVYFYFRAVKPETNLLRTLMWGVFYFISAVGFYSFMTFGILKDWNTFILFHDMIFAVIGGLFSGFLVYILYNRIKFKS